MDYDFQSEASYVEGWRDAMALANKAWDAGYAAGLEHAFDTVLDEVGALHDTDDISDALHVIRLTKAEELGSE